MSSNSSGSSSSSGSSNSSSGDAMNTSIVTKGQFDERVMKDVPAPIWKYMDAKELWADDGLPDITNLKRHLLHEGRLNPKDAITLVQKASAIFRKEPNLLQLQDPITGMVVYCRFVVCCLVACSKKAN